MGYLVLTRKAGETLKIGDDVSVVVMGVNHGQVKIGIDAPRDVPVHREEVAERIKRGEPRKHIDDGEPGTWWTKVYGKKPTESA